MNDIYRCPCCGGEYEWDSQTDLTLSVCPHCSEDIVNPVKTFTPDKIIGDYRIIRHLGIGGMGEVFLAEQMSVKREIALKILQPSLARDNKYLERFFREVRMLAQIEHANVVKAIEAGTDGDICYFSMMYIPGTDLKKYLEANCFIEELNALNIIRQVALALKNVWDKHQLIHRDIKPGNIMVTPDDQVKLMDLGISKKLSNAPSQSELTNAGMMVGSPTYISPEQARAEKDIDFRADMYSLGATYFDMIAGAPPFEAETPMGVISRHLCDPVPDPRKYQSGISVMSYELIKRMMAKKKENRFSSWDEAIEAIDSIIELSGGDNQHHSTTLIKNVDLPQIPQPNTRQISSASKTISSANMLFKKLKWHRTVALLIVLILFIMALSGVIRKSVYEAKMKKARILSMKALKFAKNCSPAEHPKAIKYLEDVQRLGIPEYSEKARLQIKELRQKTLNDKTMKLKTRKKKALEILKRNSYDYERKENYQKAILLWEHYQKFGEFRDDPVIRNEIEVQLDYLKRKKKEKEDGYE
jgi:serine/threonine protein kinase